MIYVSISPNLWSVDVIRTKRYKLWLELQAFVGFLTRGDKTWVSRLVYCFPLIYIVVICIVVDLRTFVGVYDTKIRPLLVCRRLSGLVWVNGENIDH